MLQDPVLPAAAHLVGPHAASLLDVAVAAAGGSLVRSHLVQVQHHPGRELVARHEALVSWNGEPARAETLLTGCTRDGAPVGTLPLEADGLEAGVWRYPFDPVLIGLADAVTPGALDQLVAPHLGRRPSLDVVAYRPLRRAVVRASGPTGTAYVKVVAPDEAVALAATHARLLAAGLPVPEVLAIEPSKGILVLAALPGQSLRDVLLDATAPWPAAAHLAEVAASLRAIPIQPTDRTRQKAGLGEAARHHAGALLAFYPACSDALERILPAVESLDHGLTDDQVLSHGDLYEAQVMVVAGAVHGVLDLDDVQAGHPLDDLATALAHLHLLHPADRRHRDRLRRHRAGLRRAAIERTDPSGGRELDLRTAATLVGLAIGPYRAQRSDWRGEVARRLAAARRLVQVATREKTLRRTSRGPHPWARQQQHEVATAPRPITATPQGA